MRRMVIAIGFGLAGCSASMAMPVPGRALRAERDLVAYASASCFAMQAEPLLKQQGELWAGGVMQRAHGPVEVWTPVVDAVRAELKRSGVGVAKPERVDAPPVTLPLMTCGEIADTPAVRRAIDIAMKAVASQY